MENMNTTLEIPEGSKATIAGKNIDGKNYLVVEVEEREEPEWKKFKRGDVLIHGTLCRGPMFAMFDRYVPRENKGLFDCLFNNTGDGNRRWVSGAFRIATEEEEAEFFKWLHEEKGLEWDGEKLVEVLKEGDLAIFWYYNTEDAIIAVYKRYDDDDGLYVDHGDLYWANAIKWDGTKEQYEKVLRGEL
jgi:hypothetical protein